MINAMTLILIKLIPPFSMGNLHVVFLISQLIRFARDCCHVETFAARNRCLTDKLLKQVYRYNKLRKAFQRSSIADPIRFNFRYLIETYYGKE